MYIDILFVIILLVAALFYFRRFSSFIYLMCSIDILYRLLHFISSNVPFEPLSNIINKYVPTSLLSMFGNYVGTENIVFTIIQWAIFALYVIFLFYIVRIIIRRK